MHMYGHCRGGDSARRYVGAAAAGELAVVSAQKCSAVSGISETRPAARHLGYRIVASRVSARVNFGVAQPSVARSSAVVGRHFGVSEVQKDRVP